MKEFESKFQKFIPSTDYERRLAQAITNLGRRGIKEKRHVCPLLKALLARKGYWVEMNVSPWKLLSGLYATPTDILKEFRHPLQPDIDIFYGPMQNGERLTPLLAFEVKVFPHLKGRPKVIPKTKRMQGFYAGLDQAMALYTFGIDYASLCHVFVLPLDIWDQLKEDNSLLDKLVDEHSEWSISYMQFMCGIIGYHGLQIGYVPIAITISEDGIETWLIGRWRIEPKFQSLTSTGAKLRRFLLDNFNIKETVYQPKYRPPTG